jgi:cytochrome c oxidase cbb3-type subunit 2
MSFLGLHKAIERNTGLLIFGILVVASIGGLVQVLPTTLDDSLHAPSPNVVPYAPLELVGRDVYISEGCSTCHSQQVRPLLAEVKRYGPYARSGEFAYDRPFLWGSKRTGPDLLRMGGKYSDAWHRVHMVDPRAVLGRRDRVGAEGARGQDRARRDDRLPAIARTPRKRRARGARGTLIWLT